MQLPTITINQEQKILVRRMLPGLGEVLVQRGQVVRALDVVARLKAPSAYQAVNLTQRLGHKLTMKQIMMKKIGQTVKEGEIIATRKSFLRRKSVYAPTKGRIAAIAQGWVLLETEQTVTQMQAFVDGTVSRVIANRGVVIETSGTIVQAECGFGGEAHGVFRRMVGSGSEHLDPAAIDAHSQNTILLAGQSIDEDALRAAEEHQVQGIVVGSIDTALLTLDPPTEMVVVATEGFGDVPMSSYTFNVLRQLHGQQVSIRGVTPSLRRPTAYDLQHDNLPVIMAASNKKQVQSVFAEDERLTTLQDLRVGSRVRVTHGEWLGSIGTVESFPEQPEPTEAGIVTPGAYLTLNNTPRYIPLANLEQIV